MSLILPHTNSWGFIYSNQANGAVVPGISVIPGASDVEGSYTEIAGDADITTDIYYVVMTVNTGLASAVARNHLLDLAYDAAGGTTYAQTLFSDLACGGSGTLAQNGGTVAPGGRMFHFPCRIPAGSAVAARVQGTAATPGTLNVHAKFYGKPSRPELWRPAAYSETLGYTSGSLGTGFTPGTTDWGTWVSLGTTTKRHFWAQLGVQINNGTKNTEVTRCQLAIGDGTNMHVIIDDFLASTTAEAVGNTLQTPCTWEIPAGAELYVRGNCSGTPATGYNATVILFGG